LKHPVNIGNVHASSHHISTDQDPAEERITIITAQCVNTHYTKLSGSGLRCPEIMLGTVVFSDKTARALTLMAQTALSGSGKY